MSKRFAWTFATTAGVLGLAVSIPAQAPAPSGVNFGVYVSLGDSLTAGFSSNSLVRTHQVNSYPAQIARQGAATDFQLPLVNEPGLPPELQLAVLSPAPVILPKATTPGLPANLGLTRSYNNLGVPGATSTDLLTRLTDSGGVFDLILRGRGTALAQAAALKPTFVTLWIGNNDVLAAAVSGRAIDGVTLTPTAIFRSNFQQIITALRNIGAKTIVANIPDVTTIPYVTTIKPYVVDPSTGQAVLVNGRPVPLIGPTGPISSDSYVLLPASAQLARGQGIPTAFGGTGTSLTDDVILDPTKQSIIRDHVTADNQAIQDICGIAGYPVVDINGLLRDFFTQGRIVGGIRLSSGFLTGGIFSYDGVHPTDLGYGLVANEFIRVINANGGNLDPVDLSPFIGVGVHATSRAQPVIFSQEALDDLLAVFHPVN